MPVTNTKNKRVQPATTKAQVPGGHSPTFVPNTMKAGGSSQPAGDYNLRDIPTIMTSIGGTDNDICDDDSEGLEFMKE